MIIRCDQCESRFRLDESRIPERGARVRCSKCDHSFVVRRPEGGDVEVADQLAREAVSQGAVDPPKTPSAPKAPSPSPEETSPEGNWEFGPTDSVSSPEPSPAESAADPVADPASTGAESSEAPTEPAHPPTQPDTADPSAEEDPLASLLEGQDGDHSALFEDFADAVSTPAQEPTAEVEAPPPEPDPPPPTAPPRPRRDPRVEPDGPPPGMVSSVPDEPALETDHFGDSGVDFSGTGNLDSGDLDFDEAAQMVAAQNGAPDHNEDSLAALGDPSAWDLLADVPGETPSPDLAQAPPPSPPPPPTEEALFASPSPASAAAPTAAPSVASEESLFPTTDVFGASSAPRESIEIEGESAVGTAGLRLLHGFTWPIAIGFALLAASNLLRPPPEIAERKHATLAGGFVVEKISSRLVENALAGPMLVVSGEIRNPTAAAGALRSALAVTLCDPSGERIEGARAVAAPPPGRTWLREADPAILRAEQAAAARGLAHHPLAPGDRVPFSAVFMTAPSRATSFTFDQEAVPAAPMPIESPSDQGPPVPERLRAGVSPAETPGPELQAAETLEVTPTLPEPPPLPVTPPSKALP